MTPENVQYLVSSLYVIKVMLTVIVLQLTLVFLKMAFNDRSHS